MSGFRSRTSKGLLALACAGATVMGSAAFAGIEAPCEEFYPNNGDRFQVGEAFDVYLTPSANTPNEVKLERLLTLANDDLIPERSRVVHCEEGATTSTVAVMLPYEADYNISWSTHRLPPDISFLTVWCDSPRQFRVESRPWPYATPSEQLAEQDYGLTVTRPFPDDNEYIFLDGTPFLYNPIILENTGGVELAIHGVFPAFKVDRVRLYPTTYTGPITLSPGDKFYLQVGGKVLDAPALAESPIYSTSMVVVVDDPVMPFITFDFKLTENQLLESPAEVPPGITLPEQAPIPPLVTPTPIPTTTPTPTPVSTMTPEPTATPTPSQEPPDSLDNLTQAYWETETVPSLFGEPVFEITEFGLLISTVGENTFGYFQTKEPIGPLAPAAYRLTANVEPTGELAEGQVYPEIRLRAISNEGLVNQIRADAVTGADPSSRTISLLLEVTESDAEFDVAVDILRFVENQTGGYLVTGFALEKLE